MCIDLNDCEEFIKLAYELDPDLASEALTRIRLESNLTGKDINVLWKVCCGGDVENTIDVMRFADIQNIVDHVLFGVAFQPTEY